MAPWAAGLDMEVSLALSVSLTFPIDHLLCLLVVLLDVTRMILVILSVAVVKEGAPVTHHYT